MGTSKNYLISKMSLRKTLENPKFFFHVFLEIMSF
jgi:hypothetical protein